MILESVNNLLEKFYKLFYEVEEISVKLCIKEITTTELHVIEAIGTESLSMNELSDRLNITMGTATVSINKLSDKNFIDRKRCQHDRRKVFVSLSKKGLDALNYHKTFHKNIISNITKDLSEEELTSFLNVFIKIQSNLKNQLDFVKPISLSEFPKNLKGNIIEVKGSPAVIEFFKQKNISNGSQFELVKKNSETITIKTIEDIIDISITDAKNIIATKL